MNTMKPYEPEMGQLCFGNPFSEYECPEYITALIRAIAAQVCTVEENRTQEDFDDPTFNNGSRYSNEVFSLRAYYWGDCTCGFDDRDAIWSDAHDHTPGCFNSRYRAEETRLRGSFGWEEHHDYMIVWAKANGYPDAPAGMAAYCDCGHDAAYDQWRRTNDHDPACPKVAPNFRCGDVEVRWYKHLLRGTTINRPITPDEAVAMFDRCMAKLREIDEANQAADLEAERREREETPEAAVGPPGPVDLPAGQPLSEAESAEERAAGSIDRTQSEADNLGVDEQEDLA